MNSSESTYNNKESFRHVSSFFQKRDSNQDLALKSNKDNRDSESNSLVAIKIPLEVNNLINTTSSP